MSENKSSRYQKKNRFVDFFSNYLGGEILLTKKFTKWLPYIGLLLALAVLSIANENLIISKKDKIKTLNSDKEKLNRKKFIEIDNHFSDEEKKELENEAYKLGLKPTPPSRIKTINLPKNKEK